jgi:hypothetical protein
LVSGTISFASNEGLIYRAIENESDAANVRDGDKGNSTAYNQNA